MRIDYLFKIVLVGAAAGFFSGLFGVGGGILMVPGLMLVLHQERKLAHGTSLAAIVPIALAGAASYAYDGAVDIAAAAVLTAGGMVGAYIGTLLLKRLPAAVARYAFAAVMFVTAVRMAFEDISSSGAVDLDFLMGLAFFGGGLLAGVMAGLLGVGGGLVLVPLMVIGFGASFDVARGTSLLVIIPTALVGTWRNVRMRQADVRVGAIVGVAGAIAAVGGVATALWMDTQLAKLLFALLLAIIAVRTFLSKDEEEHK